MPGPVSEIVMTTDSSSDRTAILMRCASRCTSRTACIALTSTFVSTCAIFVRGAMTRGTSRSSSRSSVATSSISRWKRSSTSPTSLGTSTMSASSSSLLRAKRLRSRRMVAAVERSFSMRPRSLAIATGVTSGCTPERACDTIAGETAQSATEIASSVLHASTRVAMRMCMSSSSRLADCTGWLISCATVVTSVPSAASRSPCSASRRALSVAARRLPRSCTRSTNAITARSSSGRTNAAASAPCAIAPSASLSDPMNPIAASR
jgi:hypothetical protein